MSNCHRILYTALIYFPLFINVNLFDISNLPRQKKREIDYNLKCRMYLSFPVNLDIQNLPAFVENKNNDIIFKYFTNCMMTIMR